MNTSNKNSKNTKGKGSNLLITNARIFNGTSSISQNLKSIYIDNGQITKIGGDISAKNAPRIDAGGAIVMPGLIDAHVHLQCVPGAIYRQDSDEKLQQFRNQHLRAYLASGVTTVLDNGISAPMLKQFHDYLDAGGSGPNIFALAPYLYPPGGYPGKDLLTPYWGPYSKPVANIEDVVSRFNEYDGLSNIVGVKTFLEPGMGGMNIWPIHTPEMQKIIAEQTAKRNLPLYIHALGKREQETALDMNVYTLVHTGYTKGSPSESYINKIKERNIYVMTTIASTYEQLLIKYSPERLDDELMKLTVPKEQLITAADPAAWEQMWFSLMRLQPKWIPDFIIKAMTKIVGEKGIERIVNNVSKAIVKMHNAGIPIVVGSDTATWPMFINFFHGPSMIREIEILGEAGMSPLDVILAATKTPAKMMGVDHKIGTIEVGKQADLIVVQDNPLENLSAFKKLMWIVKDGEARTPKEWMRQ